MSCPSQNIAISNPNGGALIVYSKPLSGGVFTSDFNVQRSPLLGTIYKHLGQSIYCYGDYVYAAYDTGLAIYQFNSGKLKKAEGVSCYLL